MTTETVQAADEDVFLEQLQPPSEQTLGHGQSALWTLPNLATQYQPAQPTPAMQSALQAQREGRFLDALILLDEAGKSGQLNADNAAEINLLRASFLLQGNQSKQALEILAPLQASAQLGADGTHAADAWALTAMVYLQQGNMGQALAAAQHSHDLQGGLLSHLALSYALQGMGRLVEARKEIHDFNASKNTLPSAIALAREAELSLTLAQTQAAKTLADQARAADATQPYVIAVSGLTYLIDGHAKEAKAAFEAALKRDPKDAKALFGLGLSEIKLGNFPAGQKQLQAAVEADPGNALILTYLGRSQQQSGQTEAARASWNSAEQADPKDPTPWLYQAQAALQANRPQQAQELLREAQARLGYRQVYRGENLLGEDRQLLQANLAEAQRRLGLDSLAFHTLSDTVGEKNSATLRNQADALQGQRFGESARRSLLLQSLFVEKPGNLSSELDVYGDGAGQTGAAVPQHGAISGLGAQQTSLNNYDNLFSPHTTLTADATTGSQNTNGEQLRLGTGSDTLGVSLAQRQYKTDGYGPFNNLDNHIWQSTAQWRTTDATQLFVSHQHLNSLHGEIKYPADPYNLGEYHQIQDNSSLTRLGLRESLSDSSELRGVVSRQQTDQIDNWEWIDQTLPYSLIPAPCCGPTLPFPQGTRYQSSKSVGAELQYRNSGTDYVTQWGASAVRAPIYYLLGSGPGYATNIAQQLYVDWQQALNPYWQLEAGLAREKHLDLNGATYVSLLGWMPRLGVVYTPDSATHVRLAAWKGLDNAAVGNASLAPATLAGFVLYRPGEEQLLKRIVALGADKQFNPAWLLEGQAQRRFIDAPQINGGAVLMSSSRIDESRLALHWQPSNKSFNVTMAYDDEFYRDDPTDNPVNSVLKQHLRSEKLDLRWLAVAQWTANLAWSHNLLASTQNSSDINNSPIILDVRNGFNQTDASLNWQFSRMGSVDMGVRNATGAGSQYTEMDPFVPRFSKGRLSYAKVKFVW